MSYTTGKVRSWSRASDNDGDVFDDEYNRIYGNVREMMNGLAKSTDYTILATDEIGLLRATNAITKRTGKSFNTANPVNISDVGHGLVTGDTIVTSNSSAPAEVGNLHYTVTRINDDNFTLDDVDNSAGAGGTLDWRKDVKITLPAAASHTDNIYTIMKVDVNEGAVDAFDNDGTNHYYLLEQYDWVTLKSDGTNWVVVGSHITHLAEAASLDSYEIKEYIFPHTEELDYTATVNGAGAGTKIRIAELPLNTTSILVHIKLSQNTNTVQLVLKRQAAGGFNYDLLVQATGATAMSYMSTYEIPTATDEGNSFYLVSKSGTVNGFVVYGYKAKV